jgi:glycosyltransferase involved in cell wall biosynthesis
MAVERDWRLDLGGYGRDERIICDRAMRLNNVRFHGRLPYDKVIDIYARANVILATYDPSIPNHRFSSANKLFEAMMLGKAIVVARDTGMDQVVEAHCLGRVVQYGDSAELREALTEFASWSPEAWGKFSAHVRAVYSDVFSWSLMKSRLQVLYSTLPARVAGRRRLAEA